MTAHARNHAARLVIALLLVAAGGCSSYRAPVIELVGATVLDTGPEAVQIGVEVELENPNDEPMKLLEFEYQLTVDGRTVFTGRRAAEATLNRAGRRRLTVPAVIPYDAAGWSGGAPIGFRYQLAGTLLYVAPGELAEILLDTGFRRPRAAFILRGAIGTPVAAR